MDRALKSHHAWPYVFAGSSFWEVIEATLVTIVLNGSSTNLNVSHAIYLNMLSAHTHTC